MNWTKLSQVQKGTMGEIVVSEYFKKRNYIPYIPDFDGSHPFDRIIASSNKKEIFIAEIKTKSRRTYYPDTGIDLRHYDQYKFIEEKYNIPVFIFFVDEAKEEIYGNFLKNLELKKKILYKYKWKRNQSWNPREIQYPLKKNKIIYFPIFMMETISKIPHEIAEKMKKHSNRSYAYNFPKYEKIEIIESSQILQKNIPNLKSKKIQTSLFDFKKEKKHPTMGELFI
jgi:hypothetical protein